jgi:hypothetical protein
MATACGVSTPDGSAEVVVVRLVGEDVGRALRAVSVACGSGVAALPAVGLLAQAASRAAATAMPIRRRIRLACCRAGHGFVPIERGIGVYLLR